MTFEPAWTVTAVLPIDLFLMSSQRCHSCFLTLTSCTQQRSVETVITDMEEEEDEGREFGGGGSDSGGGGTTTTTTMMSMATATDRSGGGGTHVSGIRRPWSGSTEGDGGEGTPTNAIRILRRTRSYPYPLKKNVRNNNHDSKGLRLWRFVNDDHAEDNANNEDVGERGATVADDREDRRNGEEDRVKDDNGKGND